MRSKFKNKKDLLIYLNDNEINFKNINIMVNDTGFNGDYFETNLHSFIVYDCFNYYDINIINNFMKFLFKSNLNKYELECPKEGFYQVIYKIED
tara:strand:+ start:247 stop:528 length:282 start_codon:yes stop_codon:yes gene_type:complete